MDHLQTTAAPPGHRRTIDYLRRKARNVELQAARAAPAVASQLKTLAASMQIEAEQLERAAEMRPTLQD
jgi:hypothetical protein